MEKMKIKTLVKQVRGVSYRPEDLHNELNKDSVILLRANNIKDSKIIFDDVVYVDKSKVSDEQYLRKGDVLICASSGSKNLVGKAASVDFDRQCTFGAFCKVIRPKNGIDEFLEIFFQSPIYRRKISEVAIGANINNIRNEHIDELDVPVYPAYEQSDIANIIKIIQTIITKRKDELFSLDNLIKSRFVELFGTIHDNRFDFNIATLQDVSTLIKDGTHQTPTYTIDAEQGYKFLSSKDVTTGKIDWSHLKYIPEELHRELYARISPQKGDILLAKNGTTGIAAIVDRNEVFDIYVSLALIRPCGVDTTYLWAAINAAETKQQFDASLKGVGVPNLHLGEIKKARIILPPMELQERYAAFVEQVDKSKLLEWINFAEKHFKLLQARICDGRQFI